MARIFIPRFRIVRRNTDERLRLKRCETLLWASPLLETAANDCRFARL